MDIAGILITSKILMLAAGIFSLLWAIGKIPTSRETRLEKNWIWRNILPVLPILLGAGGACLPGVVCDGEPCTWGVRIIAGIWAGFVAAHGRKIFKRIVIDRLER